MKKKSEGTLLISFRHIKQALNHSLFPRLMKTIVTEWETLWGILAALRSSLLWFSSMVFFYSSLL